MIVGRGVLIRVKQTEAHDLQLPDERKLSCRIKVRRIRSFCC